MVKYIECYPEYQKFEEFLKSLIRILNLSCIPSKILRGYEKFFFLIFEIYFLVCLVFALVYYKKNIMEFLIKIMMIAGVLQILTKILSILMQPNKFKILFLFIQEAHQVHEVEFLTDSSKIYLNHLKKALQTIKIILRIIFPVCFMSAVGIISYCIYIDSMLLAVPGVFPDPSTSLFYQHIHQFFCMEISINIVAISDSVLISIGFYFIAVLNIFQDIIQQVGKFERSNKERFFMVQLHKFHCNILDKFSTFNEVFYYAITVQIASSVVFILCIFFLMLSRESIAFIPLFLSIFGQFGAICIFGELIYSKTQRISTELYLTNWYELDLEEQKILLMMMCMSQKTLGLKAAGVYDINLRMFIEVIKAGVSFCAILYTLT
uniref:Odorant receptor n=1 Tax=Phlebotomus papatasi TaxID=29031 RepID=A0A240SYT9_PHLPP